MLFIVSELSKAAIELAKERGIEQALILDLDREEVIQRTGQVLIACADHMQVATVSALIHHGMDGQIDRIMIVGDNGIIAASLIDTGIFAAMQQIGPDVVETIQSA